MEHSDEIVAASTVGGVWQTQRAERKRATETRTAQEAEARRQDERHLLDAKREREGCLHGSPPAVPRSSPTAVIEDALDAFKRL